MIQQQQTTICEYEAIVVCLDSTSTDIKNALTNVYDIKLTLDIVGIPNDEDWGTADSLRHIKDKIKSDIIVLSCDLITDIPLHRIADVHRTYDAAVTMLLANLPDQSAEQTTVPGVKSKKKQVQKDIVGLDDKSEKGRRVVMLESEADVEETITVKVSLLKKYPRINMKTTFLDAHLYIMKKWIVDFVAEHRSMSSIKGELLPYLVKKQFHQPKRKDKNQVSDDLMESSITELSQDIYSFAEEDKMTQWVRQMSTWNDHTGDMAECYHSNVIRCYAHVVEDGFCIRANTLAAYVDANRNMPGYWASNPDVNLIHSAANVKNKSQVGHDCMIGEGSSVSDKVSIKKSIIGKHCNIGDKVKISSSVVMDHVTIAEGCTIHGSVICSDSHINEHCDIKDSLVGSSQTIDAKSKFNTEVIVDSDRMMEF
ncbi:translation initiation factor eIF2B subunit gamma-like isoform X2 [Ptychodera flava]|uniref:translation initiation factor eIF2B subunit gamma-like isoform X2 n=1 Tax=Ptychodera flava TaxID=63121 RepID=UPI00396A8C99